ncbi:hypothetical protein BU25DRAFT_491853 [Macroventuria anomochaeta]|uniref:Uncharacterized protein n=1 Tax=Macroventuria anomochaeta TaxID=301207 RepID=A0ACB6RYZ5_9PLEO|nr:uncharacterized protein BU25DRAFT_491853 [Macroventuria anomochaeta]KAF2626942.1 hypothetical protein BU25DRAFT_491853 [Macroventuria anomochaeta]
MPSFEVQRCTEADIPRVFEIVSLSFANDHEYVDAVFPAHGTPEGRKIGSERMLQMFHGDPNGNFMKVVDKDSGKIVAAAKWNVYKAGEIPPQPEIDGDYWENEEDKEFAQRLFHGFFAPRQKVIEETNGNLVALEMMMVDPAYQKMGAGRLLVQWGLTRADELGVDAVVEGSERGRQLYASEGFGGPHYVVPVPEKFAARRKQTYWWMRRPAQNKLLTP